MAALAKLRCWLGRHDWTCKAEQGIPPSKDELEGGLDGFWRYAAMYCKRCGKVYRP